MEFRGLDNFPPLSASCDYGQNTPYIKYHFLSPSSAPGQCTALSVVLRTKPAQQTNTTLYFSVLLASWICWSSCKVFRSQATHKQKEIPSSSHFFAKKLGLLNAQHFPSVAPFVVGRLCFSLISALSHSYRQHHPPAPICQPLTSVIISVCFVTIMPVVMLRLWNEGLRNNCVPFSEGSWYFTLLSLSLTWHYWDW